MKRLTTAGVAGLAMSTVGALVLGVPGTSHAAATKSSAYGAAFYAQGSEAFPPTPYVESTDGSEQTGGGSAIPDNPLLTGSIALMTAGNDAASVELVDLSIGGGLLEQAPPQLTEGLAQLQAACDQIPEEGPVPTDQLPELPEELPLPLPAIEDVLDLRALCDSLAAGEFTELVGIDVLNISCAGDTGTVEVGGVSALGVALEVPEIEPNMQPFPENPLLDITINRQTQNGDGSFTVDGLVVELAGGAGELVLGSVTCGEPIAAPSEPDEPNTPPAAPAPTPVPANVPVTG